jgi:hypothetical protein
MEASSRSSSFGEGEVERGVTLPPLSAPCMTPCPHREAVPLQTGSTIGEQRPKHPLAEAGLPTDSSRKLLPTQESSDHEREEDPFIGTNGEKVGLTPRPEI